MTSKTRYRLIFSVLILAFTLPAETILLKALQAPTDSAAVEQWASSLDSAELATAAASIESYPSAYRKQIMSKLSPAGRAGVWRAHIDKYVAEHKELSGSVLDALKAAKSALTDNVLGPRGSATEQEALKATAVQLESLLGREEATVIAAELGPKDGTFASREPLSMKLASFVRNTVSVSARALTCDCNLDWGCTSYTNYCDNPYNCQTFETWPRCGWWWNEPCDGNCFSGW